MTLTAPEKPNGVAVDQLMQTVEVIQGNPSIANFTFRAHNTWLGGGHSKTEIQGFWGAGQEDSSRTSAFTLEGDEPAVLLGENLAPNAVEVILHALASCMAVGTAYNAAARGIHIRSLSFDLEGELDLHGFLGMSDEVRAGYDHIKVMYEIDSDATEEQLDDLCNHVQKTSPVLDMLRNPVHVTVGRR